MANLTITASSVIPPTNARITLGIAGEALTTGMVAYKNPTDGLWYKADCLTAIKAGNGDPNNIAVVLAGNAINQSVALLQAGQEYTVGASVAVGTFYIISATANGGNIAPSADLATGNFFTPIGYATSSTKMWFMPNPTGLQKA